MTETKTVLGRVFTRDVHAATETWFCELVMGGWLIVSRVRNGSKYESEVRNNEGETFATAHALSFKAAILALQSTLRKMAELEVVRG